MVIVRCCFILPRCAMQVSCESHSELCRHSSCSTASIHCVKLFCVAERSDAALLAKCQQGLVTIMEMG